MGQGTVNRLSSVKLAGVLHLTPSGVAGRVVGDAKKKEKNLTMVA